MKKYGPLLLVVFVLPILLLAHGGDEEEHVIRMTNNGFEPSSLTIGKGEEVIFINDDDVNRWPASNLHPTHGLYPEFDPQKALKPGDLWAFVFEKTGTWRMHDHLTPSMTGAITVVEEEEGEEDEADEAREDEEEDDNDEDEAGFLNGLMEAIEKFFDRLSSLFG